MTQIVVLFLEHSSDPSSAQMSWYQALLVLMTDVFSKGSGEHVHLCILIRVSLLTNIKFEVDEDSG